MFNPDSLRRHLEDLSDEEILETNPVELTEEALAIYEEVMAARGLSWDADEELAEGRDTPLPIAFPKPEDGNLVPIDRFANFVEARFAYTLLRQEQIPVWLAGQKLPGSMGIDPNAPIDLVTLPEHLEAARELLNPEFTDEELAAMAEEAGDAEERR
jgi:hypothetical protein